MDKATAQDKALAIHHYLELMWGVHSKFEGMNMKEATLYRVGIQTFLLEALKDAKELLDALEVDDEDEEEMLK